MFTGYYRLVCESSGIHKVDSNQLEVDMLQFVLEHQGESSPKTVADDGEREKKWKKLNFCYAQVFVVSIK